MATYKGDGFGVDIGPLTVGDFHSEIEKAKTFFWNGPMGIIEMPRYALGASAPPCLACSVPIPTGMTDSPPPRCYAS